MKCACKNNLMNISVVYYQNVSGFRQAYGTQNCLLAMIEKLRKIRDKKGIFAAVLSNLLEALDCIPHNLPRAKLSAYGFDRKSLMFISAYLKKQETMN